MAELGGRENAPKTVVWWRVPRRRVEVGLQDHRVGWATPEGRRSGFLTIRSHHLRLDTGSIERALREHLASDFGPQVLLALAGSAGVKLGAEVQLLMVGHQIVKADLFSTYGSNVIAGVTAQQLGRGCSAIIAFDEHLSMAVRQASAAQIVVELASLDAPSVVLQERGWSRTDRGRWELLLVQL